MGETARIKGKEKKCGFWDMSRKLLERHGPETPAIEAGEVIIRLDSNEQVVR